MKILVILTGGTIACKKHDGWLAPDDAKKYAIIDSYKDKTVDFDVVNPYTILSEDLSARYINILLSEVKNGLCKDYDSIIIAHGTDTLCYSAAALNFAFGDAGTPIILVSSGYPIDDKRSNGAINFECAVKLSERVNGGVYVCYKNNDSDFVTIHNAGRLMLQCEGGENLFSLNDEVIGIYNGKINIINNYTVDTLPLIEYTDNPDILVINSLPTYFEYSIDKCKAIIIRPYHSGTISKSAVEALCNNARERNIPIYLAPSRNADKYESTRVLDTLGIKPLDMPFASAYVYIWHNISGKC